MKAKHKACPICGRADKVDVLSSHSKDGINIGAWSCGCCRHSWRTEPWETSNREKFFDDASYTRDADKMKDIKQKIFEEFLRRANKIKPQLPRLMVDFGCSYGSLMQMFKETGWDVMGIEISPSAQEALDKRHLPWAVNLKSSGLTPGSVDIVVMSDCSCYLPNPIETLTEIRRYLKSDGCLFIRQPTHGRLLRVLSKIHKKETLGRLWWDHMHAFTRKSTAIALNRAGFGKVAFHKEKGFRRTLKNEMIHRVLRVADLITFRFLDLTLTWIVVVTNG